MGNTEETPLEQVDRIYLGDGDVLQVITFGERLSLEQLHHVRELVRPVRDYCIDKAHVSLIEIGPEDNVSQLVKKYAND